MWLNGGGNVAVGSPCTLDGERPGFKFRPCICLLGDLGQVSRALCVLTGKMEKAIGLLLGAGADGWMLIWIRIPPCSQCSPPEGRTLRICECPGQPQDLGTPTKDRWGAMGTGAKKWHIFGMTLL